MSNILYTWILPKASIVHVHSLNNSFFQCLQCVSTSCYFDTKMNETQTPLVLAMVLEAEPEMRIYESDLLSNPCRRKWHEMWGLGSWRKGTEEQQTPGECPACHWLPWRLWSLACKPTPLCGWDTGTIFLSCKVVRVLSCSIKKKKKILEKLKGQALI